MTHTVPVSYDVETIIDLLRNVSELTRLMNNCVHVVFYILVLFHRWIPSAGCNNLIKHRIPHEETSKPNASTIRELEKSA
jgi:hypothetical protein